MCCSQPLPHHLTTWEGRKMRLNFLLQRNRGNRRSKKQLGGNNNFQRHITSIKIKPGRPPGPPGMCINTVPLNSVNLFRPLLLLIRASGASSSIVGNFLPFPRLVPTLIFPNFLHTELWGRHFQDSIFPLWSHVEPWAQTPWFLCCQHTVFSRM